MLKATDLYIDLGTANTLIYARNHGFILNEPSILAIRHRGDSRNEMYAVGHSAKLMLGKTPEKLSVLRPLREGVISDFDNTNRMLHAYMKQVKDRLHWLRPRMIISLPCQVSQFERRAVEEVGYSMGARKVHLLDEPVAAAIGAGVPVLENRGHMVVDIGGGTTEIVIISLGGIVAAQAVRIGGDNVDTSIIDWLRVTYNFLIGEQTAERIKIHVASALNNPKQVRSLDIGGFNMFKGLPDRMTLTSTMIFPAVDIIVKEIIQAVRKVLEACPPEIAGDIVENGVILAGGGALMCGLQARLSNDIGLPVKIAEQPLMSVAMGGAKALEDHKLFDVIQRPA